MTMNAAEPHIAPADVPIDSFQGDFAFLSNFYITPIVIDAETYPTAEHAFQALKTDDPDERKKVREASTPTATKARGKKVTLRANWNEERFKVMNKVLRVKFSDPDLLVRLAATGKRELIEGNTWRDTTWGCTEGKDGTWKGRNELGRLLMKIREEIAG